MLLALKIDVDTLRGTREGVPRLIEILRRHDAGATFLFSVGPDHTGRAIKRVFRPGFVRKVRRTSVVQHYGFPTLLYGTLLPGPDIGKRAGDIMRRTRDEGFDIGLHAWDHVRWQDGVDGGCAEWTGGEMQRACERYTEIFKEPPRVHGAEAYPSPRVRVLLGRTRHAPTPAGVEGGADPLPAASDDATDARRNDRRGRRDGG
jgi:undecaprenyl phosphate-alpha-L-ara4FN deformylase